MQRQLVYVALLSLSAACAMTHSSGGDSATGKSTHAVARGADLARRFPEPRQGLGVDSSAPLSLKELTAQVSRASGMIYSFDATTLEMLSRAAVGLTQSVELEPAEVHPWFEALLVQHGFVLHSLSEVGPAMVVIERANAPGASANGNCVAVSAEHVEFLHRHPALRAMVTLNLPHVDVRTLGNSMRALVSDPGSSIVPIANTQSVVLCGNAAFVARAAELLAQIEAASAASGRSSTDPSASVVRTQ